MQNIPDFSLREIVPGIHAVFGGVCNRGIITSRGNVLLVDSGISVAEAIPLRAAADEARDRGFLALFNTHPHLDHVFGNQLFADVPILAQQGVRETLLTTGAQMLANVQQNPQMAAHIGDVTITPPTVTFQDRLTLFVGEIEVQLIHFGVAHSPSDSVAWLPQISTLFTGDLLFNTLVPAMPPGGNSANWISALKSLEQLGAEHVIPGHGPIESPAALAMLRTWIETLRNQVIEAVAQGLDRETAISKVATTMQTAAPRASEERLPRTIGSVYDEVVHKRQ